MTVSPNGKRCSSAHAFLFPIEKEPNLVVRTQVRTLNLTFDGSKCTGVEYIDKKTHQIHKVQASREVISCLGAVGTPRLLLSSGIGPVDQLEANRISVKQELAEVGQNLRDHLEFYIQYLASQPISLYPYASTFKLPGKLGHRLSPYLFRSPFLAGMEFLKWMVGQPSICASNHFEVGCFTRLSDKPTHPDCQYHFIPACVLDQMDVKPVHPCDPRVAVD